MKIRSSLSLLSSQLNASTGEGVRRCVRSVLAVRGVDCGWQGARVWPPQAMDAPGAVIKLNVGGTIYCTTMSTLCKGAR